MCFQNAIKVVKNRLYRHLDSAGSRAWPAALKLVTQNINDTPMKALGFMSPNQIQSGLDEPAVREAKLALANKMNPKQRDRFFPEPMTYTQMMSNKKKFDSTQQKYHVGSFVYVDKVAGPLTKASEEQKRGQVYIVSEIIKTATFPRYKLINLLKVHLPASVYGSNLQPVPKVAWPSETTSYRVEKIIKYGQHNGVDSVYIKWQNYGKVN
jgi:hypothetical protein